MAGNIGLRTTLFPAIDIDARDPHTASLVERVLCEVVGVVPPRRIGEEPKRAFLFRLRGEPVSKMQLRFEAAGRAQLVELLGDGQQMVVEGIHPRTGKPYHWPTPCPPAEQLPELDLETALRFFAALEERLDFHGFPSSRAGDGRNGNRPAPEQESLKGDLDRVRSVLAALPNTPETFPTREDYLRVGYALKAALPDHPEEAYALWWSWANLWPEAKPDHIEGDWARMRPPFAIGASYLYELGRQFGGILDAHLDFDAIPEDAPVPQMGDEGRARLHSDLWFGEEMILTDGEEIRHDSVSGRWYSWTGRIWTPGVSPIRERAKAIAGRVSLAFEGSPVRALKLASAATVAGTIAIAQSDPRIAISSDRWDANPNLLNTPGGVVDLRTGELLPHRAHLHMTRSTAAQPEWEDCPVWKRFLLDCTGGDEDLAAYYRRFAGYCLTGLTHEQVFAFLFGPGGNGKGLFANTLKRIMGTYADVAPMNLFLAKNRQEHPTSLAALCGARLVLAQELSAGQMWDEQLLKGMTGGDQVKARFVFRDEFSYLPTFKVMFSGNHLPRIGNVDPAMERRTHIWPFHRRPAVVDPRLMEKLSEEHGAILAWAIQGAVEWYRTGLRPHEEVLLQTRQYLEGEDLTADWIAECCDVGAEHEVLATELCDSYVAWCEERKIASPNSNAFGRVLSEKGFGSRRGSQGSRYRTGLRLKSAKFDEIP